MTWDQFVSGLLSLGLVAVARLVERWLPNPHHPTGPPGDATAPPAPDTPGYPPQAL